MRLARCLVLNMWSWCFLHNGVVNVFRTLTVSLPWKQLPTWVVSVLIGDGSRSLANLHPKIKVDQCTGGAVLSLGVGVFATTVASTRAVSPLRPLHDSCYRRGWFAS
ncbi:hypothetical protein B0O80DRAFT_464995 [Mortierella sp. GBAus27b]|nr:hypothetical protein B0O80DRAFT_464995 [Mortierella sp. GBAus27b]